MPKNKIKRVIFIVADAMWIKNMGIYGATDSKTPNLDKLGKEGLIFKSAYTTITKTEPSLTAMLSGKYPITFGLVNNAHNISEEEEKAVEKILLLPQILKKHGLKTAAIDFLLGWHKKGFDYYSGKIRNPKIEYTVADKLPLILIPRLADQLFIKLFHQNLFGTLYYSFAPNPHIPYDPADYVIKKAINVLNNNKNKLFLFIHLWDAHEPYIRPRGIKSLTMNVDDKYAEEVAFLDEQIGKLISYLKETKKLDSTLIVFTSDHGENFYQHDTPLKHEGLYEDVTHVPLIMAGPTFSPKVIDSLVSHVDIFPTILNSLGIEIPRDIDGKSLIPLIAGKIKSVRDFVYFEDILFRRRISLNKYAKRRRGIRIGQYKYIKTIIGKDPDIHNVTPREDTKIFGEELYDLKKDPNESKNLIKSKPDLADEMRTRLSNIVFSSIYKRLDEKMQGKIKKTISILKKTSGQFKPEKVAVAFKGGKDTMVMLHIIRSIYKGKVPFKLMFNDTTMEFRQTYEFIEKMRKLWNLDLKVVKHSPRELQKFHALKDPAAKNELARLMKITAIANALKKYKFKAFMAAIRRDEHPARAKEKYFVKKKDHTRIHPMLHFTEKDIWDYIHLFGVPYSKLYDKGYRSVGEKLYTEKSKGRERSGRDQEKEQVMAKLRKMGYW